MNTEFPKQHWKYANPEEIGVNNFKLQFALSWLNQRFLEKGEARGLNESLILKNGSIIWSGPEVHNIHPIWSCTKSFTSTVLGILIEEGKCSLDTKVITYVPQIGEQYSNLTLRHLATMTSGYNAKGCSYDQDGSIDPFQPDTPLFQPGTYFLYWDDPMNLFGLALTRIAHESLYDVFMRRVGNAIGITSLQWGSWGQEDGITINGGSSNHNKGVSLSALDFARFGLLYLNCGKWDNKQVISEQWVHEATKVQVDNTIPSIVYATRTYLVGSGQYGYNWWINGANPEGKLVMPGAPKSTYYASGLHNNKCFVIPEWDLVFVRMGCHKHRIEGDEYGYFFHLLEDAMK